MELRPAGSAAPRHNFAPERVGFAALQTVDWLFEVSTSAPPPWWSRERLAVNTFTRWRASGTVELSHDGPATRGAIPDWGALQGFHTPVQTTLEGAGPLHATSTRFRFGNPEERVAQVVRAAWPMYLLQRGERLGIWLRANPPPGHRPSHPWAIGPQRTRIYMGTLPYRQLLELEYNRWYFISSDVESWRRPDSRHDRHLIFWPAHPLDGEPEIEVNTIDLYEVRKEPRAPKPGRSLGFVQSDESGNMQILLLGVPGQAAFWRQRMPFLVEADTFRHVIDPALLTTAETPEEDPPEVVRHTLRILEDTRLLEVAVDRMPDVPSETHLRRIQQHFPLIAPSLRRHAVGALLLDTTPPETP